MTVIADRCAAADAANAWRGEQGYAVKKCFAKRLSHSDGPTGSTVARG